jgi:N6-adenosine-specific RNA methylase IME4
MAAMQPIAEWLEKLGNAEFRWQGTRGSPRRLSASVRELVVEPRRFHSQNPDCVCTRIEQLYPGPYLELFARSTVPGWDSPWAGQIA